MFPAVFYSSDEGSVSSPTRVSANDLQKKDDGLQTSHKKRKVAGNPDPDAEVVALSPETLLATNRFICEICNKGFQRDQNLQLHRRGHNLPWKLKQRESKDVRKKVYVCPEPTCLHNHPSRALGDLTGIKKHYSRKHGEKKWSCEKCSKVYAVQADWKAHSKICGTREYRCETCGTLFSRKDSINAHQAFCNALAEESSNTIPTSGLGLGSDFGFGSGSSGFGSGSSTTAAAYPMLSPFSSIRQPSLPFLPTPNYLRPLPNPSPNPTFTPINHRSNLLHHPLGNQAFMYPEHPSLHISAAAAAILQRAENARHIEAATAAAAAAATTTTTTSDVFTRDFLGLTNGNHGSGNDGNDAGGSHQEAVAGFPQFDVNEDSMLQLHGFGHRY